MWKQLRIGLLTAVVLPAYAIPLSAQARATTADLQGLIRDESGAVIPNAGVSAIHAATNIERTTVTEPDGRFIVPALPPGIYRIRAEAPGFRMQTRHDVTLTIGSSVELEFTLVLAGLTETVSVVGVPPLVDTRRSAVATVISGHQIENLPSNGRDFMSFSLLAPGVSTDRTPQQGSSATSGLTFAGQRGRSNNIMVDGLDNNDTISGGVRAVFSQEAVQEFQVLTSSYSAELGKASGGIVNIVTKSGSNRSIGNAFFFGRDETLNAKEYFERYTPAGDPLDRSKAPYGQKQFGATWGGPLRRDRTFYFLSAERLDIGTNNFVNIDDSQVVSVGGQPVGTAVDILERAGFPVETGNVPYAIRSNEFLTRIDHQVRSNERLTARLNWAGGLNENIEPWGGLVAQSRGALVESNDVMLAASYTSFPSSKTLNELRAQVAYRDQAVLSLDPSCTGRCDQEDEGGPTLELAGVASVGRQRFTPQPRENIRYQVQDTLSQYRGRHNIKVGFDYSYIDNLSGSLPLHFGGRYIFAGLPAIPGVLPAPIASIQALALGIPAAYIQGYGTSASRYASQDLSVFAQDELTITNDLTLRFGVRYQNQFWPKLAYDVPGVGAYTFPTDNNNVAPRLALAWQPAGNRSTSIHATYGVFYDNHLTSFVGITDIVDGSASGVRTLVQRLPGSVIAWNMPGRRLPAASGSFPSLVITVDPELTTPYAHHTLVGVNREVGPRISIGADFLYVRGHSQVGTLDYNPLVPELGPDRRPEDEVRAGVPVAGTSASILQYTSFGQTWYRGLLLSVTNRFSNRYQFQVSYTLSKAEDNSTDFQSAFIPENTGKGRDPGNPRGLPIGFDPLSEKGPSLQDQRHRLVVNGWYVMPGSVQVSAIATVASGRPFNVLAGADLNGDGNGGSFPPDRARRVLIDPTSSVSRNSETIPSQATMDVRISRRFVLSSRFSLDAFFDVFNLFNRANFTEVNNIFGVGTFPTSPLPTFGQFEKAAPPLQAQVGVKLQF